MAVPVLGILDPLDPFARRSEVDLVRLRFLSVLDRGCWVLSCVIVCGVVDRDQ